MKAGVLCAGLGTRLRPLTDFWPKAAVPFLGQPLFRYLLASLRRLGVSAVGVNTHHLGTQMAEVATSECRLAGVPLTISHEPQIQGTAGGIRGLRGFLEGDEFLVVNGDILFSFDLGPMIASHRSSAALATIALMPMPKGESFGTVEMDSHGRVGRIAGRGLNLPGLTSWHFTGIHLLNPRIFQYMSSSGAEDINRDVYPRALIAGESLKGVLVEGYWTDLGTPRRYLQALADVLFARAKLDGDVSPFANATPLGKGSWAGTGARVEGQVVDPSFLDQRAALSAGARIGPAVYLGTDSSVESGAALEDAAVFAGATVNAKETLHHAIAWGPHRIRCD